MDEINGYCVMKSPKSALEKVTLARDFGPPEENVYLVMSGNKCAERPESGIDVLDCAELRPAICKVVEPIYANIVPLNAEEQAPVTPKKKRNSRPPSSNLDEKVASYYPNEAIYAKPKRSAEKKSSLSPNQQAHLRAKSNIYTPPPVRSVKNAPTLSLSPPEVRKTSHSNSDLTAFSPAIPKSKGRLKYATVGRSEGRRNRDIQQVVAQTPSPVHDETATSKRFTSLPRFKKFTFSPLRLRISSVLARYQGGNS